MRGCCTITAGRAMSRSAAGDAPLTISRVLYGGPAARDDAKNELVDTTLVGDMELPSGCPAVGCAQSHNVHSAKACNRVPPVLKALGRRF